VVSWKVVDDTLLERDVREEKGYSKFQEGK